MGAMIPFLDLNLLPDPPLSGPDSALRLPKIEPKPEPLDLDDYHRRAPAPPQPLDFGAQPQPLASEGLNDTQLYSEFNRISELFNAAFAHRLARKRPPDSFPSSLASPESNSQAIVLVPENHSQLSTPRSNRKIDKRSSELVRVSGLSADDERFFREVVRRTRMVYDGLRILSTSQQESIATPGRRLRGDLAAASVMREHGLWLNRDKRVVGPIPGVYIGDMFLYRMELCVVGLHGQPQAGIDYLTAGESSNGEPIATSIIVSGGYEDDEDSGDVLVYTGHGGQDKFGKQCGHQKLEGGNLAMERSKHYGIEVRVIRGFRHANCASSKFYIYDGLYRIHDCWLDVGKSGFGVYKFKLSRIEGQTVMGSSVLKFAETLKVRPLDVRQSGYLSLDISKNKEAVPVLVFNDIDTNNDPLCFDYLPKSVFPAFLVNQKGGLGIGCDCVLGCREGCLCAAKNGGEFAYDSNGILYRGKPVVFECGNSCKCPPSCRNRVTQNGLQVRLEIFRSREAGWAVRTLDLIQAGSFICEYSGVILTKDQAQIFSMNGDSLIYPSRFPGKWAEWGNLSRIFPNYMIPSYPSLPPIDFAMDVSRMRNVACYISHSSSPNVFVQYVLHDHNNMSFPRLMVFALEGIPPLRELSIDYGVVDEWSGKPMICN